MTLVLRSHELQSIAVRTVHDPINQSFLAHREAVGAMPCRTERGEYANYCAGQEMYL